jgi:hypothetical protein
MAFNMWFEVILLILIMFFLYIKGFNFKSKYIIRLAIIIVVAILVIKYYKYIKY